MSWYLRCHYRADVLAESGIPVPYLRGLANFGWASLRNIALENTWLLLPVYLLNDTYLRRWTA